MSTAPLLLIPEVVQTSATDCGPACLKSIFGGFGLAMDYRRLRDACQTDVDGTSIDTMEELASRLGFEASQVMIPLEDVFVPEAQALPSIAVVRQPGGATHFVVLWRRLGPFVQAMDPATGRYWTTVRSVAQRLMVHTTPVPAESWRAWAGSEEATVVLARKLRDLGVREPQDYLAPALADPSWRGLAKLDAAVRAVSALLAAQATQVGPRAVALLEAYVRERAEIPEGYWSVQPSGEADDELLLTGAVLLKVSGAKEAVRPEQLPPQVASALGAPSFNPFAVLRELLRLEGSAVPALLFAGLLVVAVARLIQAVMLRGLLDLGRELTTVPQRAVALGVIAAFAALVALLQLPVARGLLGLGRRLEVRLRQQFFERLPQIDDRYFQSRLTSDMALRCHLIPVIRTLPALLGQAWALIAELVVTTAAILWLAPSLWPLALSAALLTLGIPAIAQWAFQERDLRVQTHNGALSRFSLDALLGLTPIRVHGAERSHRREQESLLVEWAKTSLALQRVSLVFEGFVLLSSYALVGAFVLRYLSEAPQASFVLLLVFWALRFPAIGQRLITITRTYPNLLNRVRRLLEVMGAGGPIADQPASEPAAPLGPVSISAEGVQVKAGGHVLLDEVSFEIPAGSQIAIVGPSGAGKSTLLGLLLGWFQPSQGRLSVDGRALDPAGVERLRAATAWVDPAVQLWNTNLIDNLGYGNEGSMESLPEVLHQADLASLLESLPDGLQNSLGENGGLVSGGQGQRVRLARAMLRRGAGLVLLDEPFRGLDRPRRQELLARARRLWRGTTLICVSHDIAHTTDFDQVLVIDQGHLVEQGDPAALLADPESRYAQLVAADAANHQSLWRSGRWRRLWLGEGKLAEKASAA